MIDITLQLDNQRLYNVMHPDSNRLVISTTSARIARQVETLLDSNIEYNVNDHFIDGQLSAGNI